MPMNTIQEDVNILQPNGLLDSDTALEDEIL